MEPCALVLRFSGLLGCVPSTFSVCLCLCWGPAKSNWEKPLPAPWASLLQSQVGEAAVNTLTREGLWSGAGDREELTPSTAALGKAQPGGERKLGVLCGEDRTRRPSGQKGHCQRPWLGHLGMVGRTTSQSDRQNKRAGVELSTGAQDFMPEPLGLIPAHEGKELCFLIR